MADQSESQGQCASCGAEFGRAVWREKLTTHWRPITSLSGSRWYREVVSRDAHGNPNICTTCWALTVRSGGGTAALANALNALAEPMNPDDAEPAQAHDTLHSTSSSVTVREEIDPVFDIPEVGHTIPNEPASEVPDTEWVDHFAPPSKDPVKAPAKPKASKRKPGSTPK